MSRSLIPSHDVDLAHQILKPPTQVPDGSVEKEVIFFNKDFSSWLSKKMIEIFMPAQTAQNESLSIILLGSWSREELCPISDLDVLILGKDEDVLKYINRIQEAGYKLRYRVPKNLNDWTEGVEVFDILALLQAKALDPVAEQALLVQQEKIKKNLKSKFRKQVLNTLKIERASRKKRLDSITNYLEPQIKYGPGGLRDLDQALLLMDLFPEKFKNEQHAYELFKYYKNFFITVRQKLHLLQSTDVLSATAQFEISKWMGYSSQKDFMRELQKGLSRVYFYSEWVLAAARLTDKKIASYKEIKLKEASQMYKALLEDSSVLMEKQVRSSLDQMAVKSLAPDLQQKLLKQSIDPDTPESFLISLFNSRLMDFLLPDIKPLIGYVQHDQYHRYTADMHVLQVCRQLKRIYKNPKLIVCNRSLNVLKNLFKKNKIYSSQHMLRKEDWQILAWTCLLHDLGKGRSKDHSEEGVILAKKYLSAQPELLRNEVLWMIENHLELSTAAFRKNSQDPELWQQLQKKKIFGKSLIRLYVFTVIDILGTNPEAWNSWKAQLLFELVERLSAPETQNILEFQSLIEKSSLSSRKLIFSQLEGFLLARISAGQLIKDLKEVTSMAKKSDKNLLSVKVYQGKKGEMWIRFFAPEDKTGLLSRYVNFLFSLGFPIQHASIHSLEGIGVYDWFQVQTRKTKTQMEKLISRSEISEAELPTVKFEKIKLISKSENEWILSFKGSNQRGLLARACQALSQLNCNIKSARVHTWGQGVDDIFIVSPKGNPEELVAELKSLLL